MVTEHFRPDRKRRNQLFLYQIQPLLHQRILHAVQAVQNIALIARHGNHAEFSLQSPFLDNAAKRAQKIIGHMRDQRTAIKGIARIAVRMIDGYHRRGIINNQTNRYFVNLFFHWHTPPLLDYSIAIRQMQPSSIGGQS